MNVINSCSTCKFCKVNIKKLTLRCIPGIDEYGNDKGHWRRDGGTEEHIFKIDLRNEFIKTKKEIKLHHRKIFDMAEKCEDFTNEWILSGG